MTRVKIFCLIIYMLLSFLDGFVRIKKFEFVTFIEVQNPFCVVSINNKKPASGLIIIFCKPNFDIIDYLLSNKVILSLILLIDT